MVRYSECCPKCGTWNKNMDLHETNGIYECEGCKTIIRSGIYFCDISKLPTFDMVKDRLKLKKFCTTQEPKRASTT